MDIHHLRNMLAVIEQGSLAKAAERLNVTQPALTKSVKRLEEYLGVRLFERKARGMKPTCYAESLTRYAKAACIGLAEAEREIVALRSGTEGALTIAGPPLIMTNLLPPVLVQLSEERPKLEIRVASQNRDLVSGLLDGKFNLGVAMLYEESPKRGLAKQWLFDDRLVLAMRPDHPLAKRRKVSARDLVDQKWIFAEKDSLSQRRLQLYFQQEGLSLPTPRMESQNPDVAKAVITTSDYVGMIAKLGVEKEIKMGLLKCVDIESPLMLRPIGILWREGEPMTPAASSLVRLLQEACRSRKLANKR
jgi:DNA-binding transcriptional LysR family regulator